MQRLSSVPAFLSPFPLGLVTGLSLPLLFLPSSPSAYFDFQPRLQLSLPSLSPSILQSSYSLPHALPISAAFFYSALLNPSVLLLFLLLPLIVHLHRLISRPYVDNTRLPPAEREAALRRRVFDSPPPFSSTWYRLCASSDVSPSHPLTLHAFSHTLTITRLPSSTLLCLDAHLRSYPVLDHDRAVLIYYHPTPRPPPWHPPSLGLSAPHWRWVGRVEREVPCHLSELPENGVDLQHFNHVHGPLVVPLLPYTRHRWEATWRPQPAPRAHLAAIGIESTVAVAGCGLEWTRLRTVIEQVGPALVNIRIQTWWGVVAMQETVTPVAPLLQRATHTWYADAGVPWVVAKMVAWAAQAQFDRDIPVWSRKRLLRRPMTVREDGAILQFRRWMKQFYEGQEEEPVQLFDGDATPGP